MYFQNSCPWVKSYGFIESVWGAWIPSYQTSFEFSAHFWVIRLDPRLRLPESLTVLRKPLFSNFLPGAVWFFSLFLKNESWSFSVLFCLLTFWLKGLGEGHLSSGWWSDESYFSFLAFTHFKAVSSWSSALKPVANAVTRRRRQGFL